MKNEVIWLSYVNVVRKEMALSTHRLTDLIDFAQARGCEVWFPRHNYGAGHAPLDISTFRCVWR